MQPHNTSGPSRQVSDKRSAIIVFICFVAGYFLSYTIRTVNATLAPWLTADLNLSPADLGWLTSAYFLSFALMQWPLGIWLDRFGARRVNASLLLVASAGALLMATGQSLATVSTGRILVGIGVAACLMAPYSYFRRCYPPERQAQLGLWMLVGGTSGSVVSTLPVGAMAAWLGWRSVFALLAVLMLTAALAIFIKVPDDDLVRDEPAPDKPESGPGNLFRNPVILRIVPVAAIGQGGMVALQTLWIGPWLTRVLGMDPARMTGVLFSFTLTLMSCYIAMSFLGPALQRRGVGLRRIAETGHFIGVPLVFAIALTPFPQAWVLWLLLALTLPAMSLLQPALTLDFPKAVAGRVLTLYNLFMFIGTFSVQWAFGLVVDAMIAAGLSESRAFQASLLCLAVLQTCALLFYLLRAPRG